MAEGGDNQVTKGVDVCAYFTRGGRERARRARKIQKKELRKKHSVTCVTDLLLLVSESPAGCLVYNLETEI